ncbi:hypothetical protein [Massilia brevitalea]|uniref:hypothetical protein n=1 Tax=Massilia brevitalea TaxID=442526 RepID=UPI002738F8DB|nr:hypothetical protein [Massilia brevitalea]
MPDFATTISGVHFNPRADLWDFQDGLDRVNLDFFQFKNQFSDSLIIALKAVLMHASQELAPRSLVELFKSTEKFSKSQPLTLRIEVIDETTLRRFWGDSSVYEGRKFVFKSMILRWVEHRYAGIEKSALQFLRKKKPRSRVVGESVLTWDPISGPLTDIEFKSFYESFVELYAKKQIQEQPFLMAWLVTSLGIRPRQVALLKAGDISKKDIGGTISYSLSIPRIKQKGQIPRDEMYEWPVLSEIGELLYAHGQKQKEKFAGLVKALDQSPLFSADRYAVPFVLQSESSREEIIGRDSNYYFSNDAGDLSYHMAVVSVIDVLREVFNQIDVSSERVGSEIVLNARRLRKTYGTRLAADNVPAPVLAAMLGHRDIKSSKPYIAATSRLQDRLDKTLAFELAPLAQAFRGEFLTAQDSASTGAIIRDLRVIPSGEQLGKCDKTGYCGYAAPVACYTCKKFRPWKDAPHELIFEFLWERRKSRSAEFEKDAHMTMLHDRTILAVAQVILECGGNVSS